MSTSTFESNIKQIPHKQESVYRTLSDLNNLQMLKDRFEQVKDQIPEDKRKEMQKHIETDHGFLVDSGKSVLYGLCPKCR